ncbi:hypothetical protein TNIN_242281 [Trichonephila inaurata madagascariensis]|uniref:Uncharacterized protein n=1 Tax=Trichonephila inaurata madagascariensis TaxID=2747483 RepID=A0A8X6XP81_9ARAC|nr:hypothetical protein TNIN_242281 [Trichonephila inaurata madagascariensis]
MLTGFRATAPSFRPLILDPLISRGNDTSRKVSFLPPSARQIFAFQHFSSVIFGALTCSQLRLRRGRGCAWTFRHTLNPFTGHRKGVSPVRERPLKLIAEVAYIKVAPVSLCEMTRG